MRRSRQARGGTEVLYVSSVASPAQFAAMKRARLPDVQEVTYGMPESGFKFHSLVQRGLLDAGARVHSLVGRSATPLFYRGGWWPRVVEGRGTGLCVDHRAFPNVRVLKQLWLALSLTLGTLAWRWRTRNAAERLLVVDGAYVSALPGVLLAGRGIPRIAIFCDVYSFMADVSDASGHSRSPVHRLARAVLPRVYSGVDGFVLLTEQMGPVVNRDGRPHIVMEGLVDSRMEQAPNLLGEKTDEPTVLYAGALRVEYGLQDLVRGFLDSGVAQSLGARLVVYGNGDYAAELRGLAETHPGIEYRGTAPMEEVVAEEQRMWLLVNPRPVESEFTALSFPSKNMEYLASGTPVLTTRLPGMPQEYYAHVSTIDVPGPEGVARALATELARDPADLHEQGCAGRDFVLGEKNENVQARRILDLAARCR
ncbi:glycosyltransferase [Nocardioides campestrisoli]|uniref:glycosyltransferase n=1 Tax=Nocardioides campestrisoli TaxID=2736757 RepID=UPI00163DAA24|nr:glycosyltransferase [Nocardioides campestrisoli]